MSQYPEKLTDADLLAMYRWLLLIREFEDRTCSLASQGGVYEMPHGSQGQEAISVGACYGLRKQDLVLPSLRTRGALIVKGIPVRLQVAGMFGKVDGAVRGKSTTHHMADPDRGVLLGTGLIGSDITTAVGAALALRLRDTDNVVVDFFGDGAAQRGDFHEGLNFAGVFRLPIVFVLENNHFAEYTPLNKHFAGDDFACRAQGYGFPGLRIDGNDVIAVYEAVQEALTRARTGNGPTLIECVTYRLRAHNEVKQPDYLRDAEELEAWHKKDPITLFETKLQQRGLLDESAILEMRRGVSEEIDDAITFAEESPFPDASELMDHVYAPDHPVEGANR